MSETFMCFLVEQAHKIKSKRNYEINVILYHFSIIMKHEISVKEIILKKK